MKKLTLVLSLALLPSSAIAQQAPPKRSQVVSSRVPQTTHAMSTFKLDHSRAPQKVTTGKLSGVQPLGQDYVALVSADESWAKRGATKVTRRGFRKPLYFVRVKYTKGPQEGALLPWRSPLLKTDEWTRMEGEVLSAIQAQVPPPQNEEPSPDNGAPSGGAGAGAAEPHAHLRGIDGLPFLQEFELNSAAVDLSGQVAGLLYEVLPNEVTAIGVLTTDGLALFDHLNDGQGVRGFAALPLTSSIIFVPDKPLDFTKNMVKLAFDPEEQLEVLGRLGVSANPAGVLRKSIGDTVASMSGGGGAPQMLADLLTGGEDSRVYNELADEIPGFRDAQRLSNEATDEAARLGKEVTDDVKKVAKEVAGEVAKPAKEAAGEVKKAGKKVGKEVKRAAKKLKKIFKKPF